MSIMPSSAKTTLFSLTDESVAYESHVALRNLTLRIDNLEIHGTVIP